MNEMICNIFSYSAELFRNLFRYISETLISNLSEFERIFALIYGEKMCEKTLRSIDP